jgi:anti-sigma factor RsiW
MKTMQCDRVGEVLGAYLDQELDAATRREVAAHLGGCGACSALAEDLQRLSRQVAALGPEPAPEGLMADVRRRLARDVAEAPAPRFGGLLGVLPGRSRLAQAAALLVACTVTAGATAYVMSRVNDRAALESDVFAAHVRSLLQDSPTQVASSDTHTVKPWFAGRLEFAPNVRDLAAEGFPLAGARLDYVGGRRVAALVYRRRLHVVNVFVWPSPDAADSPPRALTDRGYNILTWRRGGVAYWAISDLSMDELRQLQSLL